MISFHDLTSGLRKLNLDPKRPVIVHASLSAFGRVRGGSEAVVGALLTAFESVMAPTHTYRTMVIPRLGPPHNGVSYGSGEEQNALSEIFRPDMPADRLMGLIPETLRRHSSARRSRHPILSFAGVRVEAALQAQTRQEPFAPVGVLAEDKGWVLLMGVNHTVNTSIHYAERLAGRRQFTRWALTPHGVRECPGFPGCSEGFEQAAELLAGITRQVIIGQATVKALPLRQMIEIVTTLLHAEPLALLCRRPDCERCNAIRSLVTPQPG